MENFDIDRQILWITNNLKNLVIMNSLTAWRYAGALESYLLVKGGLKIGEPFKFKSGGKKYLMFFDMRWIETYPQFILRKAEEYLSKELKS